MIEIFFFSEIIINTIGFEGAALNKWRSWTGLNAIDDRILITDVPLLFADHNEEPNLKKI